MTAARKTAARPMDDPQASPGVSPAYEQDGSAEGGPEQPENQAGEPEQITSQAEGITLAVSVALLLGVIGLLIYLYVTGGDQPAVIQVRPLLQEQWQADGRYYLPVEIQNTGDNTASSLEVELALSAPGGEQETAQFSIQFLAGQDTKRAVATFRQDPTQGELTTSISYLDP
jgi:uncharacterized protein (TIGR02588 family)